MSALTKWNPFREMETMQNRLAPPLAVSHSPEMEKRPSVCPSGLRWWTSLKTRRSIRSKRNSPEVKKEDVKVSVEDGSLHISGERKFEKEKTGKRYHRIERAYGSFDRVFVLPDGTKPEDIRAEYHDGLLNFICRSAKSRKQTGSR